MPVRDKKKTRETRDKREIRKNERERNAWVERNPLWRRLAVRGRSGEASSKNWINMHGMASVPGRKLMCLWKSARRGILASRQPFNSTDDLFEESGREHCKNLHAVVIAYDQFNISTRSQRDGLAFFAWVTCQVRSRPGKSIAKTWSE